MHAAGRIRPLLEVRRLVLWLSLFIPFGCPAADWPQYRGSNHDGVSTDRINKQWSGSITNPVWIVPVTNGLCSLAVSGGRLFTQMWLNVTNGFPLWATPVDDASYPSGGVGPDDGPRSTPTIDGGSVFVLSSYLKLYRLNAADGSIVWQRDLRSLYGGTVIGYQNCASPLLENGLLFFNANCGTSTLMAFHADDGSLAWRSQNEAMTHSTPVLATINGVRQVIFATQSGLVSLEPQTGNLLWKFAYPFVYTTSIGVSPVVYQDMVFVCGAHAYGMGSVVMQAGLTNNSWTTRRLWYTNNPAAHWMTPVCYQGFLYGQFGIQSFDGPSAQLKCIEMRSGVVKWSTNGFGRGSTIVVDDHLLSISETGQLVLVKPNTNACTEVADFRAVPNYNQFTNRCWNAPAVSDGRVYVRSTAFVACFDFSVPDLKLDAPQASGADQLAFTIRTVNGAPLGSNRVAGLEVRATTDIGQGVAGWATLTNVLALTNGAVRVENVNSGTQRFFIVTEPK